MSKTAKRSDKFAAYPRLNPLGVGKDISAADLIEQTFLAYNGGRLREGARLLTEKMLAGDGVIGMSLTGALTPAGLGKSCLIPLLKAGFVDWIVSTGANLYHDMHYGLDMKLFAGSPFLDDIALHREGVIRIYDVLFDYNSCWIPTHLCEKSFAGRSSNALWAPTNFIICWDDMFTNGAGNLASRTARCSRPLMNAAFRSSRAAQATVRSA